MYHYTDCGLPNIFLKGGVTVRDTEYGEAVSIHNLKGLHKAIGLDMVHKTSPLTGAEVRFLRKEMDLTQNSLGDVIKASEASVRGWEAGRNNITPPADALLRLIYLGKVNGDTNVCGLLEEIGRLDREIAENDRNFEENNGDWQIAA
jgi:DNA-binding transcriptional regulator YiaG